MPTTETVEAVAPAAARLIPSGRAEVCALVLQGGGALGAYQAGVYEQMNMHGFCPNWVAGVSIGAINAAIIAGNPPERRVEHLREFWELVTSRLRYILMPWSWGNVAREVLNESRAALVAEFGAEGFFEPRFPPAGLYWPGSPGPLSYYDTSPLKETLERLIDFDLINTPDARQKVRLSVGAVHATTGNYRYFDSANPGDRGRIDARHIMASGALPPGFPPIEIDGEYYWDGGLVSNTPLVHVISETVAEDMLVLQVDLFSSRSDMPRNIGEVAARAKEIHYASRTRLNTDRVKDLHEIGAAAHRLASKLPASLQQDPDLAELTRLCSPGALTILHLIYRGKHYETQSRDYEFSRQSMLEHWRRGAADVKISFEHPDWLARQRAPGSITVLDLTPRSSPRDTHKEHST